MPEKLSVQWNDFKDNAIGSLGLLKDDKDFLNVTLASEDGKQIEAHKVILAISSPFFQNLLKRNKHPHPLIYMRGVKSDDLLAIVNFLYFLEANVRQENLDSFFAIAEELQLKGLIGTVHSDEEIPTKAEMPSQQSKIQNSKPLISKSSAVFRNEDISSIGQEERAIALKSPSSGNLQEIDEKCISMMEKTLTKNSNGLLLYSCKSCGKEGINNDVKRHIEAKNIEGIVIPCNSCEKIFRTRRAWTNHLTKDHQ